MHPPTHALLSWLVAESVPSLERRDRAFVLAAGLVPDLDALTILGGRECYETWHRMITHNALTAGIFGGLVLVFSRRRVAATLLAFASFHLHLFCDVIGAAGPDGSIWPVAYFMPFDRAEISWKGQWGLASWQNVAITVAALVACGFLGVRRGRTIVEAVSLRADAAIVATLRARFSRPTEPRAPDAPPT